MSRCGPTSACLTSRYLTSKCLTTGTARWTRVAAAVVLLGVLPAVAPAQRPPPIIDMHLHAHSIADYGGGMPACSNRGPVEFPGVDPRTGIGFGAELVRCPASSLLEPAATDAALMEESIAMLVRYNIAAAVTTGTVERVSAWRAASGGRVVPATFFDLAGTTSPDSLRALVRRGEIAVFAEVGPQYDGATLDDPRFEPYLALAEELDVPIGIHLGEGPPGGSHTLGGSPYRARLGSPLQLEEVLVRHPRLRIWVMHYASPLVDEMIALLYSHPQVYVDIAANNWGFPRAHFYAQLRRLVDAGFASRIMWGSDQMIWPGAIAVAIETIQQAPFLTEPQKRAIFYDNAAGFLRLSEAEIARHHGRVSTPEP